VDSNQPSGLAAEIEQLRLEQEAKAEFEQAGRLLNMMSEKQQALMLIIHRQGVRLSGAENLTSYAAGNLALPEFRASGNTYALIANPVSLANYADAPTLTEVVGAQESSPEREEADRLELERLLISAELAKSQQRLHLASSASEIPPLEQAIREGKARLQQVAQELERVKG